MMQQQTKRRWWQVSSIAIAGALILSACGGGGTNTADPTEGPTTDTGTPSEEFESPILTELVESGDLPELAERLPATPMVIEPWDSVGQYGGTLRRAQTDAQHNAVAQSFANAGLLEWNWDNDQPIASLAETYEKSDDNRVYTFTLREGLKWSDGEPFTVDDLMFTVDHYMKDPVLMPFPPFWFSDATNETPEVEATDENTIVFTFNEPFALFEKYMAHPAVNSQFIKPKHYLEQFHPDLADDPAAVDASVSEAGFDSWDQLFADRDNAWTNTDRPVMGAYMVTESASSSSATALMERNPYYWKTDPDGRQLPYIDNIQIQVLGQEAIDLRAANGDLDFQVNHLGYGTTQVYLQNADERGFKVLQWDATGSLLSMNLNVSHQDEDMRELFLDDRFRKAFSHAINREEINQALLGGLGTIQHPIAPETSPYYVEGSGHTAIEFDVDAANQLLDEIGLTETNSEGTRLMANGDPVEMVLSYVEDNQGIPRTDAFSMVASDLAEVGIKLVVRPVDGSLYAELRGSNGFDVSGTTVPEDDWDLEPVWYIPTASNSHSAPGFGAWNVTGGAEGIEPPQEFKDLIDNWNTLQSANSDEERIAAGQAIMQQHNDELYVIGLLKLPFQPVVIADNLVNVRDDSPKFSFYYGREGITKPEQLYFNQD